jgi:hypothetical protein
VPPASPKELHGWLPMTLGILAVVVGAVWSLQGLNVLTDSQMSDERIWALIGPAVALLGLILIIYGARRRTGFKRRQAAAAASQAPQPS